MTLPDLVLPGSNSVHRPVQLITPVPGIVVKTKDVKGNKIFINLVMHDIVKMPVDVNMCEVSREHIDQLGLSNLRVPLDVSDPRETEDKQGQKAVAIDVLFNTYLVEKAIKGQGQVQGISARIYFQQELASLAIRDVEDVLKVAIDRNNLKILKCNYKGGARPEAFPYVDGAWDKQQESNKPAARKKATGASEGLTGPLSSNPAPIKKDNIAISEAIDSNEICAVSTTRKNQSSVVKKGFLMGDAAGKLYRNSDGTYGSNEQAGAIDASEQMRSQQLSHLPEGLRKKCAIVDTTKMSKEEIQDAMSQYANTGRVLSGPAAPGGSARNDPQYEREFAKLYKKAESAAPEPTFALGGLRSSGKSRIKELQHKCSPVHEEGQLTGFTLTVNLPEDVSSIQDVDVEVSAFKVEIKTRDGSHALNLAWPSPVDPDAVSAKMKKKTKELKLVVPVARD